VIGSAECVTHQTSGSLTVTSEQATSQASAQTQTQVSTTPTQTVTHIETTTQAAASSTLTVPATVVQTVTQSSTGTQPLLVIQQNDLLTISLIGAGLILIAALVLRRLRQAPPPTPPLSARQTSTPAGFCADCGAPRHTGVVALGLFQDDVILTSQHELQVWSDEAIVVTSVVVAAIHQWCTPTMACA
jgi:hypothetical protein